MHYLNFVAVGVAHVGGVVVGMVVGMVVGADSRGPFVGAAIAPAQAFVVAPSNITDQQFNQLILDGDFSELFVAESRAGFTGSEREFGINKALVPNAGGTGLVGGNPLAQGQLDWTSGETVEFHLSYNALTGEIAYTVDGELLNATVNAESPNGIYIRTNAQGKGTGSNATTSSSMSLENLMLDDGNGFQAQIGRAHV